MDKLKKCLDQIRSFISEVDISFTKNPIEVLKQVIVNPVKVKSFKKDFRKFENPETFLKILYRVDPRSKSKDFRNMFDYVKTVLKNSLEITDLETNFLSLAICLRHIANLKSKLDIQKCIARVVVKYRQKPKALLHLEPVIEGAKNLPDSIRNLISVALIQYVGARVLK
jgi:hypothetical protein